MNYFDPSKKQLKQFGLLMAGMFCLFAAIFAYKSWYVAMGVLGVLVIFFSGVALVAPIGLLPVYKKWNTMNKHKMEPIPTFKLGV